MPISPADVIAGTLRRAGIPDADVHARAVAADLAGHSLLADNGTPRRGKRTTPPQRCREHPGTAMENGRCPICGGTETTTTTNGA